MEIDKYYQEMIDEILNGASDREQLNIIHKLVVGLKEWNKNCEMYCEELYYDGLSQIERKIIEMQKKEDIYNKLEELSKEDLLKLLMAYSDYVMSFYEEHDLGSFPVCIYEFYDNEYQELGE